MVKPVSWVCWDSDYLFSIAKATAVLSLFSVWCFEKKVSSFIRVTVTAFRWLSALCLSFLLDDWQILRKSTFQREPESTRRTGGGRKERGKKGGGKEGKGEEENKLLLPSNNFLEEQSILGEGTLAGVGMANMALGDLAPLPILSALLNIIRLHS